MSSINRDNGYLFLDHRNAAPVDDATLIQAGLPLAAGRGVYEAATIYCTHCGSHFLKRPEFDGTRVYCKPCNHYICNPCARAAVQPDYVHRTFEDLTLLVQSGKFTLSGSASAPILIPTGVD